MIRVNTKIKNLRLKKKEKRKMKASHRDLPGRSLGIESALAARYGLEQLTVLFYHYKLLIGVFSRLGTWVPD
jgi:hypothetical protein